MARSVAVGFNGKFGDLFIELDPVFFGGAAEGQS